MCNFCCLYKLGLWENIIWEYHVVVYFLNPLTRRRINLLMVLQLFYRTCSLWGNSLIRVACHILGWYNFGIMKTYQFFGINTVWGRYGKVKGSGSSPGSSKNFYFPYHIQNLLVILWITRQYSCHAPLENQRPSCLCKSYEKACPQLVVATNISCSVRQH